MTTTTAVTTDQLEQGDTVLCHGMTLTIDQPIRSYPGNQGQTVYCTDALIENWDELERKAIAGSHTTAAFIVRQCRESRRWTIQGNEFARWSRA